MNQQHGLMLNEEDPLISSVSAALTSACPFFSFGFCCFVAAGLSQIIICLQWNYWFIIILIVCDTGAIFLSPVPLDNIFTNVAVTLVAAKFHILCVKKTNVDNVM